MMEELVLLTTISSGMKDQDLKPTFSLPRVFATTSLPSKLSQLEKSTRLKYKQETQ
jgi:hypothetical protein